MWYEMGSSTIIFFLLKHFEGLIVLIFSYVELEIVGRRGKLHPSPHTVADNEVMSCRCDEHSCWMFWVVRFLRTRA